MAIELSEKKINNDPAICDQEQYKMAMDALTTIGKNVVQYINFSFGQNKKPMNEAFMAAGLRFPSSTRNSLTDSNGYVEEIFYHSLFLVLTSFYYHGLGDALIKGEQPLNLDKLPVIIEA